MDPSYLKDLLWRGREVEFDYGSNRYTLKLINYRSSTEYSFGKKWGNKITSKYLDTLLYSRDYGASLYEMLKNTSSSNFYVY